MKIADADIILVPGYTNSGEDHWQSRWERKFKTAWRVDQDDWHKPVVDEWTDNLVGEVATASKPAILVGHSLGCHVIVQSLPKIEPKKRANIAGAFLVAPPDVENPALKPKHLMTFGPYPREPLPFPSVVIASQNDRFCSHQVAGDMANAWGSLFMDAGESGHINADSGHGPWPEGLMVFAEFMKKL